MERKKENQMGFGISRSQLELRSSLRDGETPISDRLFHLIFGGTLVWGFLLNVLIVYFCTGKMVRLLYSSGSIGLIIMAVVYLVCCFIGNSLIHKEGLGTSLIGFHLIAIPVGLLLSVALYGYDPGLVLRALSLTLLATSVMTLMGMLFPQFFTGIAPLLGISLLACVIAELLGMLLFPRWNLDAFDWLVAGIMCLYIGFDWGRLCRCARTANNAVDLAAKLYLDIVNLFLRILRILARARSKD